MLKTGAGTEYIVVTSIARQSVIIKCTMKRSVLTGNYEYYYAAGLAAKLVNLAVDDHIRPIELQELLLKEQEHLKSEDESANYLFQIILNFKPGKEYDGQMKELLLAGKMEQNLWMVTPPA